MYTSFTRGTSFPCDAHRFRSGVLIVFRPDSLNACELCGTWFTNDDHKDDHLNSCPKLPTFHKIGNLSGGSSGTPTPTMLLSDFVLTPHLGSRQNLLSRFIIR